MIDKNEWRGCEQACFILASLDHKPSGPRMVELLGHERGEVKVASAWGLTQLRLEELLPDMLEHGQSVYDGFRSGQLSDEVRGNSLHMAHLFIAFGDQNYKPAEPLMRKYLPKDFTMGYEARPAAAWALGLLYEDDAQDDLVQIMDERLNDTAGIDPESDLMRRMCAVSMGRMNAESKLESLRKNSLGLRAAHWAINRMTGEPMPPVDKLRYPIASWFLVPLREDEL